MKVRALALLLFAVGCGPTIGDPCTTAQDCLGQTCLNAASTPGGYCTEECRLEDPKCPTGSICIPNGIGGGKNGCFRVCNSSRDCRSTYRCTRQNGSDLTVCVGP